MNNTIVSYKVSMIKNTPDIDYKALSTWDNKIFSVPNDAMRYFRKITRKFSYLSFSVTKISTTYEVILHNE